jgi:Protein of unknown function (DUF2868)
VQERALRKVLLIQAIEETDRRGEALPLVERAAATREVAGRSVSGLETQTEAQLSSATEWFLIRRADLLLRSLRNRSPGIDYVLAVAGGATSLDRGMLVFAFAIGVLFCFLDGGRAINIFALPLILLIVWNLLVYVLRLGRRRGRIVASTASTASRASTASTTSTAPTPGSAAKVVPRPSLFANFYSRWARTRIDKLLGHSTRFNAPLAPGLRRFAGDWWEVAQPLFAARARRLLHLSAMAVALGLIAGYYFRGIILRAGAGWAGGSALGPGTAHTLLAVLYGPASLISGIELPPAAGIAELQLTAAQRSGGDAAPWIHLIAWTAGVYILLPRLIAALFTSFNLWRLSRRLPVPPGIVGYVRTLFAAESFQSGNGELHDV